MATRQAPASPSRASSISGISISPSDLTDPLNPDVFSDDYALEPLDGPRALSPIDSIQNSRENLPISSSQYRLTLPPPLSYTHFSRPSSTSKQVFQDASPAPNRAISLVSHPESTANRTSSTSSRFTMPRAQSPFVATNGPSHPYAMYPQVTRVSSIASESTIRPTERSFIPTAGPEHPYAMYPQNTLLDDESTLTPSSIPVGFPGMGQSYGARVAGNDIADIVGADGHIEELPPYTRYPENAVPKGPTENHDPPSGTAPVSPTSQLSDSQVQLTTTASRDAENNEKGWRQRGQKRVCCGLSLWAILVIVLVVVVVGTLGGVIGAVVGKEAGADSAASATTTVWVDASLLPTVSSMPSYPTGFFEVPLGADQLQVDSGSCVLPPAPSTVWGCSQAGGLDFQIICDDEAQNHISQVYFRDYSQLQPYFQYGPQPPNLTQNFYELQPSIDKDDGSLALFFCTNFTKVTILPGDSYSHTRQARSKLVAEPDFVKLDRRDQTAEVGEAVWVCYWDQTIFEFFLYPNGTSPSPTPSGATGSSTVTQTPITSTSGSSPSSVQMHEMTATSGSSAMTSDSWETSYPTGTPPPPPHKRSYGASSSAAPSTYPRTVKIIEKRKPAPNPQPYCVKMEIQPDWTLIPCDGTPTVYIDEDDYPMSTGGSRLVRRGSNSLYRRDSPSDLLSNCACEWVKE